MSARTFRSMGRRVTAAFVAACMLAFTLLAPLPAMAYGTSISGTVYRADGTTPLSDITVKLWRSNNAGASWGLAAQTSSGANGTYAFSGLLGGMLYVVQFIDSTGTHVSEYYNGIQSTSIADATRIDLTAGDRSDINVALPDAGAITGTVRSSAGVALQYVHVNAYRRVADGSYEVTVTGQADTGSDGRYKLGSLPVGDYAIQFYPTDPSFAEHFRSTVETRGVTERQFATPVSVAAGQTVAGVDETMLRYGAVSGLVSNWAGTKLSGVSVEAYRGEDTSWVAQTAASTTTTGSPLGYFACTRLVPGRYRFALSATGCPRQFYSRSLTLTLGADVIVSESATTSLNPSVLNTDSATPTSNATGIPSGWATTPVSVTIDATDVAGGSGVGAVYYRIGGGSAQRYSAPVVFSSDGVFGFQYWAVDGFNNAETPHAATVRVDCNSPSTVASPSAEWRSSDAVVTLDATDTASGVAGTLVSLNGAAMAHYVGPLSVSAEGTTTLTFRSNDVAGNAETTRTALVRIDKTAPETTAPADASYIGTATIPLAATDAISGVASTRWSLDGGAARTGDTAVARQAGSHTLEFASADKAGNVETTKSVSFTITEPDDTAPITSVFGLPSEWWSEPVTFSLVATDPGGWGLRGIRYRVGASEWATYTAPVTVAEEGDVPIEYYAVDLAGNAEQVQTAVAHVDLSLPTCALSPAAGAYSGSVLVSLAGSDAVSSVGAMCYSVDDVDVLPYEGPFVVTGEGLHTVTAFAVDLAGNIGPSTSAYYLIDSIAPTTTAAGLPDGWVSHEVTVTLSADDGDGSGVASTRYRLGSSSWSAYDGPVAVSAEGTTTIEYGSIDAAGNRETTRSAIVLVDTRAPVTTTTIEPSYFGTATIDLDARDAVSGVSSTRWSLDGGPWNEGAALTVTSYGDHTLAFYSTDLAGNAEEPTTVPIVVLDPDTTPPVTTVSGIPSRWTSESVTFSLEATDGESGVAAIRYRVSGSEWATYTAPVTVSAEGTSVVEYYAADKNGNEEAVASATVLIDRTAPAVSSVTAGTYHAVAQVIAAATDSLSGIASVWVRVDGGVPVPADRVWVFGLGAHVATCWAYDGAGNRSEDATAVFRVVPKSVPQPVRRRRASRPAATRRTAATTSRRSRR